MKIKVKLLSVLIGIVMLGWGGWWAYQSSWKGGDFLIMEVEKEKLTFVNISPSRGMINSLLVLGSVDLWIPNGMGYYPTSKLQLILEQENSQPNLGKMVAFYNFGLWPVSVIYNEDWQNNRWLWKNLGPLGWLRFRLQADDWLQKKETISGDLSLAKESLEEKIPRDMAENDVIEKNIRLVVVNASGKNGFGNMVADRLGWWGIMVTTVDTREEEDGCQINYNSEVRAEKDISQKLADILVCKTKGVSGGGMEVVLGKGIEEMIKYSETYVRTF